MTTMQNPTCFPCDFPLEHAEACVACHSVPQTPCSFCHGGQRDQFASTSVVSASGLVLIGAIALAVAAKAVRVALKR